MSILNVNKINPVGGGSTVTIAGIASVTSSVTAPSFVGSGANLTSLPAANLTGSLPAISAANLTNIPAANLTGTLPAISGANLTGISGDKILQVVSTTKTDPFSSSSTSYVDVTGLSATITPASSSNKIMVLVTACGNTNGSKGYGRIVRGSTAIAVGDADGSKVQATFDMNNAASGNRGQSYVGSILDSPNTTSATTYKLQIRHENGAGNANINRLHVNDDSSVNGRYSSTITLMEVSV